MPPRGSFRIATVCVGLALLGILGCSIEKPVKPGFDTNLYVPLSTQRITGADLVDDSPYVDSLDTGLLGLVVRDTLEQFSAEKALELDLPGESFATGLDSIRIADAGDAHAGYELAGLDPGLSPGFQVVAPFSFSGVKVIADSMRTFDWLRLSRGRLLLSLRNQLGVPVGTPAVPLLVRVLDERNRQALLAVSLEVPLAQGDSLLLDADLAGRSIGGLFSVEISGASPGSGEQPIEVGGSSRLDLRISLASLAPAAAHAVLQAQPVTAAGAVLLPDSIRLREASVGEGSVELRLANLIPIPVEATLRLPEIFRGGVPVEARVRLPAGSGQVPGYTDASVDLAASTILPSGGRDTDRLRYEVDGMSVPPGDRVWIDVSQSVSGVIQPYVRLAEMSGSARGRTAEFSSSETSFDPPAGMEELGFQSASLRLDLESTVGMASEADLLLKGFPASGSPVQVPLHLTLAPHLAGPPARTTVVWDESSSNLLELIRARPQRLVMSGTLRVGTGEEGTLSQEDFVRGSFELATPLRVRVGQVTHRGDPFRTEISEEDQKRIRENAISGIARGVVENHFPAGLAATMVFADTEEGLTSSPGVVLDSVRVEPGRVDAAGRVTEAAVAPFELALRPEQVRFFARDEVFGQLVVTVRGSEGDSVVEVTTADYVQADAMVQFQVRVQP